MQKSIQTLFEKPMNRREFLAHLGAGMLAIVGFSGVVKALLEYTGRPHQIASGGFGSSTYGGRKR